MILSRTPFRLSFFGGGTDYPAWYRREGGAVLSTTIDKYCYLSVRQLPPFFTTRHRVVWSHVETVGTIAEILHPAVREGLRLLGYDDTTGIEIHHQADLPARAGMGSSSSFAVGLVKALTALRGQMIGRHALALTAMRLEQEVLAENVGSQDQVAAAYGGLNLIEFRKSGEIRVDPVTARPDRLVELQRHLMLFYTGTSRFASAIAGDMLANLDARRAALLRMRAMVDEALAILTGDGSLDDFGRLLHESWLLKRSLSPMISNETVDDLYAKAVRHGALGGKLLGAGSSGFLCFFVPPHRQASVLRALAGHLHVPFAFENEGSRIIHYGVQAPAAAVEAAPPVRRELAGRTARAPRTETARPVDVARAAGKTA
ncbi:MAG: kinase [Deltaproteobacteria bacterium]|nr:kinase [Deltaproteobacteria bacterium]